MKISEKIFEAKIEKYKKQYPDWEFKKLEHGWVVIIKGEQRYIETASEEAVAAIKKQVGVDITDELYISYPNFQKGSENTLHTYVGLPFDAITTIREGNADALSCSQFLGNMSENAIFFFNREVGEPIQKCTIKGFKDAQFGYIVTLHLNAGWGASYALDSNGDMLSRWDFDKESKFFDTYEEAQAVIGVLEKKVEAQVAIFKTEEEFIEHLRSLNSDRLAHDPILEAVNAELMLKFNRKPDDHRTIAHYFKVEQRIKRRK